jgi:pyruvate/2-oxoglutarate dehydrogenase complex dihydrolipoamide dehydrogenase (E3) component
MKSETEITQAENFDVLVLGSGEAGKYIAWEAAKAGNSAAVIERRYIGGSCPNIACLPSKNLIHSAKVVSYFGRASEFGINVAEWSVDPHGVFARKRTMVQGLVEMHVNRYEATGAKLILGEGHFVAPKTIEVRMQDGNTRLFHGEQVVISTGSRAMIPPIPGLVEASPLTHVEAMDLNAIPSHLIVLGGGYVGLELGQAFRRFGSKVTILDRNSHLAHQEDEDISIALAEMCSAEGIDLLLNATVDRVSGRSGDKVALEIQANGSRLALEGSHLLVALGRLPNTDGLGLEAAGIARRADGYIQVDDSLRTAADSVWAVGDCAGSPHFTHIAFDDFRIVRENMNGGHRTKTGRLVPYCLFTDPELGHVGLSETEAKQRGIPYRLAKLPMQSVLRARTLSETRGFMKALIDTKSDRVLGFTAFGADAGEVIAVMQLAIANGIPYTAIRDSTFAHPTIAEGLTPLLTTVPKILA